jgi:hypothetical protein
MRQVTLLIGRQSYSMKTSLSDEEIKDAQAVVNDALRDTGSVTSNQEVRLAVACMVLGNKLANAGKRVEYILSLVEETGTGGKSEEEEEGTQE